MDRTAIHPREHRAQGAGDRYGLPMRHYDVFITPTTAFPVELTGPESIDGTAVSDLAWIGFNYPRQSHGRPAAGIPAGWTDTGLPVGLQIIGRHLDDATVIRLAAAIERVGRPGTPQAAPDAGQLGDTAGDDGAGMTVASAAGVTGSGAADSGLPRKKSA
ncbi:amidase family protein [Nocardia sp. NPDC046763]|uniref:amidase family protein n=1 Tax=Nocardia sp. NPDC046763 TaxID=3155256 RepID=UPI0033D3DC14